MTKFVRDSNNEAVHVLKPLSTENIGFSATPQSSTTFTETGVIRISCTEDCHVEISSTADSDVTVNSMFLPQAGVEYFSVHVGDKVAVVQNATTGNLFVTRMK